MPTTRLPRATRALLYTRVSKDQAGGRSVTEQEADGRQVIEREGWTFGGLYSDNDKGASRHSRKARPDWQRLMADLQPGDVLVSWEVSRGTRDLVVWAALVAACQEHGIPMCVGGRVHDMNDPDDAFALNLQAMLGVRESDVTRKRVLRAVRANAVAGRPHGRMLYGYAREYDPASGVLVRQVIREDQAVNVREAATRVLAGESIRSVSLDYGRRGITAPQGGVWSPVQLREALLNPAYAAFRVHKDEIIGDAQWPPILTADQHRALVAKLTDPARLTTREHSIRHLMSGLARCGVCGSVLTFLAHKTPTATVATPKYVCKAKFCVAIKEDDLDELVRTVIVLRLGRGDALDALQPATGDDQRTEAVAVAVELRARLEAFYESAAAGGLSPAGLAKVEAQLLPQIAAAEAAARPVLVSGAVTALVAERDVGAGWDAIPVTARREVVAAFMTVFVDRTGRGRRVFDPDRVRVEWR